MFSDSYARALERAVMRKEQGAPKNRVEVDGAVAKLYLLDEVVDSLTERFLGGVSADSVVQALESAQGVETIDVVINSPGGSVYDGVAIYNALAQHPATVNVRVQGLAASIASVIAMAGDTITMGLGSEMMVHEPWLITMGNAESLRKDAERLDSITDNLIAIYEKKTGREKDELQGMLEAETWMSAEESVEMGFASKVDDGRDYSAMAAQTAAPFLKDYKHTPERVAALAEQSDSLPRSQWTATHWRRYYEDMQGKANAAEHS